MSSSAACGDPSTALREYQALVTLDFILGVVSLNKHQPPRTRAKQFKKNITNTMNTTILLFF